MRPFEYFSVWLKKYILRDILENCSHKQDADQAVLTQTNVYRFNCNNKFLIMFIILYFDFNVTKNRRRKVNTA